MRRLFGKRDSGGADELDELERLELEVEAEDNAARAELVRESVRDAGPSEQASEVGRLLRAAATGEEAHREVALREVAALSTKVASWTDADIAAATLAVVDLARADVPAGWRWRIASILVGSIEEQRAPVGALASEALLQLRNDAAGHPGQLEARRVSTIIDEMSGDWG